MQHDGNLVIYKIGTIKPFGQLKQTIQLQILLLCKMMVILSRILTTALQRGTLITQNHEGAWWILQDDGNLVVYAWNSLRSLWQIIPLQIASKSFNNFSFLTGLRVNIQKYI